MSIRFVAVKCPECRADLSIEEGREYAFCSYCGTKVIMTNENEHIFHKIDDAEVKQAETDRIVKLRMLELEEKSDESRKKLLMLWFVATAALLIMGIIGFSTGNIGLMMCMMFAMPVGACAAAGLLDKKKKKSRIITGQNETAITEAMERYREKNYNNILAMFRGAGFTNVTAVPMNDLSIFARNKNGLVDSVSINGNTDFEEGDIFSKDANVLITYHSR